MGGQSRITSRHELQEHSSAFIHIAHLARHACGGPLTVLFMPAWPGLAWPFSLDLSNSGSMEASLHPLNQLPFAHAYAGLGASFAAPVYGVPLRGVRLLHLNSDACRWIGLDSEGLDPLEASAWLSGAQPWPGTKPVASIYSGHQFGMWAGQLGDGRAMLLGELPGNDGSVVDVVLKGAGPTPYSRQGDGRAVLRSTIREYVAGEAMAGLGIATTRALAILDSDHDVYRETVEKGAVLVRLSRCHVRFGTFQHFQSTDQLDCLRRLFGYSLGRWFPEIEQGERRPQEFLEAVTESTARLMAQWMSVGFCHGVMNTDNMSILGETIDYGPYAFLDDFVADHVCNHSDHHGRYAFNQQPAVGFWNVQRLAEAVMPLVDGESLEHLAEALGGRYGKTFEEEYRSIMAGKLGLLVEAPGLASLLASTLQLLGRCALDYTRFWRELSRVDLAAQKPCLTGWDDSPESQVWWNEYVENRESHPVAGDAEGVRKSMLGRNPKFIARNYLLQQLIEEPDRQAQALRLEAWLRVLASPFEEHPEFESWAAPPEGAQKAISIGCSS